MIMKVTPRRHTNLINAAHLPLGVLGIIEEAYLKNHDVTDWLGSNNLILNVRKLEPDETITLNNEKE